ncbi:MAG: hypothetical protein EOO40_02120 [Deltaproteobacteria bacterium]|nr:MAG: hypothetical protein EOO40_02120 [Deltaproteobacteria bacterium]
MKRNVIADFCRMAGQKVCCFDPFSTVVERTHSVNWLDAVVLSSEYCISDVAMLADTLVVRTHCAQGHQDDSASSLLQALLLHMASLPPSPRHMGTLRGLLTQPEAALQALGEDIYPGFGIMARHANGFLAKVDRERSGVLSTALRHTMFLDNPRIACTLRMVGQSLTSCCCSMSSLSLADLQRSKTASPFCAAMGSACGCSSKTSISCRGSTPYGGHFSPAPPYRRSGGSRCRRRACSRPPSPMSPSR